MIGKIEKSRRYAQELDRISFNSFQVEFRGEHNHYAVTYRNGEWSCECNFFNTRGVCSHTMAMERILSDMLASESEGATEGAAGLAT
jgi:hypothetical protein